MAKKPQPSVERPARNEAVAFDEALRRMVEAPPQHRKAKKSSVKRKSKRAAD